MEGVLVRPVVVVLNRRRQTAEPGAMEGVVSRHPRKGPSRQEPTLRGSRKAAGRSPRPRAHRATESARSSLVRSGFLSRWAQEVGGRRWTAPGDLRAAPVPGSPSDHGQTPCDLGEGQGRANGRPSTRTDDERRCRAAPQAPRGGSRRPKGRRASPGRPGEQAEPSGEGDSGNRVALVLRPHPNTLSRATGSPRAPCQPPAQRARLARPLRRQDDRALGVVDRRPHVARGPILR